MKLFKALIICLLAVVFSTLAKAQEAYYHLDVKDFVELQVIDPINVVHICNADSAGIVTFSADKKMASRIIFSNTKNKLKIEYDGDDVKYVTIPTITVYSSFISKVENASDSTVTVMSPTPGSSLKLRVIGNGTIVANNIHATEVNGKLDTGHGHLVLSGAAQSVKLNNTGTGTIDATGLKAEVGKCSMLGTGPINCAVARELTIVGLGRGRVTCEGSPKVKNRTIGVKVTTSADAQSADQDTTSEE
jgi:hypothetical protein